MERLTINTSLNAFVLIGAINNIDAENIHGTMTFSQDPLFIGIESLAQLAAMHVRHITRFAKHAFLLKLKLFSAQEDLLNGAYDISGKLLSHGSDSYSYKLCAKKNNAIKFKAELIIGSMQYNEKLKRKELEAYYKKVFLCLRSA